ncbi:MAG TPA: ATP-dependent DNA helicase [Steroidobacteraceae bacterium]|jgi:ATP-dependent DNA helicase DinG|nr:ATP-dependent DNA helicase [Steroidobacteraceae bacterium]
MATAVGLALARAEPLIVEAGTGTGKTFAYLVPALLSGRSVIISTGTRTLQDQLFRRDVPLLAKALGLPVKVALLKGRANYLCRHRLELTLQQGSLLAGERGVARLLARVSRWAATTRFGDLAELTDLPEQSSVWPMITSTRENCLGQECPQFSRCHVVDARRTAQAAEIVVVNHHLLLADLALKDEGFGDLLPGAEAVILDEAHQVPDIAAQFFGQSWSVRQVQILLRDVVAELAAAAVRAPHIAGEIAIVEGHLDDLRGCVPGGAGRYDWANLPESFTDILLPLETSLGDLAKELEGLGAGAGTANCARRAQTLAASLGALSSVPEESGLRWVEAAANGLSLQFTPFEIADRLRGYIEARPCAWVFTSATLAIGDDFSHFATRIGLPDARTLHIESPFDYPTQARIYLPRNMPEPQHPDFAVRFIAACAPLLEASGGRAFLLYTSYRGLAEGVAALKARFPQPPFPVLVQGQAPREALLNQFRELGNAVLLATGSFWEGVDVKGEALSIVAIDKLPFAAPDDPLLKARLEGIRRRGGNPFSEYQLPQAVLSLKQGVGRLIRDFDDFGVIVLGDPRLKTKGYGKVFLQALPPSPVITDAAAGAQFLADRLGRPRAGLLPAASSASSAT